MTNSLNVRAIYYVAAEKLKSCKRMMGVWFKCSQSHPEIKHIVHAFNAAKDEISILVCNGFLKHGCELKCLFCMWNITLVRPCLIRNMMKKNFFFSCK